MPSQLVRAAYLEFKVTRQISTGNADAYLAQPEHPPGWFFRDELGYGPGQAPSLEQTQRTLKRDNERRKRQFEDPFGELSRAARAKAKASGKAARLSGKEHRRNWLRIARKAGVRVVRGQYVRAVKPQGTDAA